MHITYEEAVSRCWAEVDLSQLVTNYRNALAHLKADTQLICVLKADAYGLGLPMVAKRLYREGQRFFAVASYNEAEQLRRAVPDSEVLVLGMCGKAQLKKAIEADMLLTVFSEGYAQTVIGAAQEAGKPARAHIKIETGLNRLGMDPGTAADAVLRREHLADILNVIACDHHVFHRFIAICFGDIASGIPQHVAGDVHRDEVDILIIIDHSGSGYTLAAAQLQIERLVLFKAGAPLAAMTFGLVRKIRADGELRLGPLFCSHVHGKRPSKRKIYTVSISRFSLSGKVTGAFGSTATVHPTFALRRIYQIQELRTHAAQSDWIWRRGTAQLRSHPPSPPPWPP